MYGDPADITIFDLALARADARPYLETEGPNLLADLQSAANGARRAVK